MTYRSYLLPKLQDIHGNQGMVEVSHFHFVLSDIFLDHFITFCGFQSAVKLFDAFVATE